MARNSVTDIKVTHIMSDGTSKTSLKGCVLPYTKETALAYKILIDVANAYESKNRELQ